MTEPALAFTLGAVALSYGAVGIATYLTTRHHDRKNRRTPR